MLELASKSREKLERSSCYVNLFLLKKQIYIWNRRNHPSWPLSDESTCCFCFRGQNVSLNFWNRRFAEMLLDKLTPESTNFYSSLFLSFWDWMEGFLCGSSSSTTFPSSSSSGLFGCCRVSQPDRHNQEFTSTHTDTTRKHSDNTEALQKTCKLSRTVRSHPELLWANSQYVQLTDKLINKQHRVRLRCQNKSIMEKRMSL